MSTHVHGSGLLVRPSVRDYLEGYVRRRVRDVDAEDTVQAVLCAALEARRIPTDEEELRRWLTGIARRKIASAWGHAAREPVGAGEEPSCGAPPVEERALVDWAERAAAEHGGGAERTLAWMAREGEGEKLESIAAEANEPAARVRQRVSRMRRWLRARWTAELAAAAGAVVAIVFAVVWLLGRRSPPAPHEEPRPLVLPDLDPVARAHGIRARALRACAAGEAEACLRGLDEAAQIDPAGDTSPDVVDARARATKALAPPPPAPSSVPAPPPAPSSVPSSLQPPPAPTFTFSTPAPTPSAPPARPAKRPSKIPTTSVGSSK